MYIICFIGFCCETANQADQNRHKQLQKGRAFLNNKKYPCVSVFWKHRDFTCPEQDRLAKKETAFQLSLLVREAGLEPARPQ